MKLRISPDLSLPPDVATQTLLVVGKRGSGKSNTAARLVEQLHHAKIPIVVLDPVDTWWGLKASRDGTGPGLDVYVFGGSHQDFPLEPGEKSGELVADVLSEHRIPMVLSVKHFSGRERSTFMTAFAKRLFQKWAGGPLHIVLEEAHEFAPQNVQTRREGEQEMLGAFKRLWKLGRASGIGGTAVTQRPASLSKDITTQSEILVAHRTIGPQDVKAIGEWVKYHGERLDLLAELPALPTGDAFVWAPEFPEGKPIGLLRTKIDLRETYDSASTPKVGETRVEPKQLAAVDIERLRTQMAATIERAKADDPKELRREIAALKKQIATAPAKSIHPATKTVTVVDEKAIQRAVATAVKPYRTLIMRVQQQMHGVVQVVKLLPDKLEAVVVTLGEVEKMNGHHVSPAVSASTRGSSRRESPVDRSAVPRRAQPAVAAVATGEGRRASHSVSRPAKRGDDSSLGKGERIVLTAIAQYPDGADREQLTVLTGYKRSSRDTYIQRLQAADLIEIRGGVIVATDAGIDALGSDFEPLPTGEALQAYWLNRLGGGEREIMRLLIDAGGDAVPRDELGEAIGYKRSSRDTYLQRLAARKLVEAVGRGEVRATPLLFEETL